jgi:hypothetical protein
LDSASIVPFRNRILILASALKSVDNPPPLQRFVAQMQPTAGFSKHFWQPTDGTALIPSEAQLGGTRPARSGEKFFEADLIADYSSAPGRLTGGNLERAARTENDR